MSSKLSFSVCRVCFAPECVASLSSLFEGNAEKAEKFKIVSGINISGDRDKHDALICNRCLKELILSSDFVERSRSAEKLYFVKRREEFAAEEEEKDDLRVVREDSVEIEDIHDIALEQEATVIGKEFQKLTEAISSDTGEKNEDKKMFKVEITKKLKIKQNSTKAKKVFTKRKQCAICNKTFFDEYVLSNHIKSVHEKKTRFICSVCPKAFYFKHKLNNHVAHCHTFTNDDTTNSNRPFECDISNCGKFFKTRGDLAVHQRTHFNDRSFKCHCGSSFKTSSTLRNHKRRCKNKI